MNEVRRYPYNSMLEAFVDHAVKTPNKLFLVENKKEITYGEALGIAYGYSKFLASKGIEEGECVVVKTSQTAATILCDMAIQLLKAIYVPLEKVVAAERIDTIVEKTDARFVISDKEMEVKAEVINLKEIYDHKVEFSDVPSDLPILDGEATGQILFTTGTTGTSKGVEMSNAATVRVAENVVNGINILEDNVEIIPVPINHAYGLRRFYANLLVGATVVLMDGIVFIDRLWKNIEKYNATGIALVPAALAVIFKLSGDKLADYKDQLKYIQIGSAVLPLSDKEKLCELLPNSHLYDFYGSSEAGCVCTSDYNFYKDKRGSMGIPTCNADFRLILEDGTMVSYPTSGVEGLLAYTGSMRMKGYWREPELTAETFKDGYVVTKDLAYFDEDGFIYLIGRQDDVINVGGSKISPTEIEEVAGQCPGIADCAVIGVPDPLAGQVPKLFVVMEQGVAFNPQTINSYLFERLEGYKTPKILVEVPQIPRTYNGKILRRELKNM